PVLDTADLVGVVLRSTLRSVMSTRILLTAIDDQVRDSAGSPDLGLLVVGEGRPYSGGEISAALGVGVHGLLAHDPRAAEHLSDGVPRRRRFDSSPLARSLQATAQSVRERFAAADQLVGR